MKHPVFPYKNHASPLLKTLILNIKLSVSSVPLEPGLEFELDHQHCKPATEQYVHLMELFGLIR